jgi:hypothetical protein
MHGPVGARQQITELVPAPDTPGPFRSEAEADAAPSTATSSAIAGGDILRYHDRVPDVLIRDVPAEDLARIDAHAARLGLSRTEYLRRRLRQEAARPTGPVTAADLRRFASRFADLGDPEVMRRAWS